MSISNNAAASGALALALALQAMPAHAAKAGIAGYRPGDDARAAALPMHVVIEQPRLKPQIAYGYVSVPGVTSYGNYPGMSFGQTAGVNLAGGLIASVLINGAEYANAKQFARGPYQLMQDAHCDLPLDEVMGTAVAGAIRARWPAAAIQTHVLGDGESIRDAVGKQQPRYVFAVSSSLAPDFSALVTSIQAEAYAATAANTTARDPLWRDTLIVVSDRLFLPAKSQADIDVLVAAANARYAALDIAPLIAKVNAAGANADRGDRQKILVAQREHRSSLKEARRSEWTPVGEATRRALLWSERQCGALAHVVDASALHAGDAVAALLAGALPAPPADADASVPDEAVGTRNLVALPGSVFISRKGGDEVALGFRKSVLSD